MLLFDGPRQHDDLACAARRERKPRFVAVTPASVRNRISIC
jgi:hypothetical protein